MYIGSFNVEGLFVPLFKRKDTNVIVINTICAEGF